ncbi:MAG: hypothetical protein IMF11_11140 [Proteobacteria bacterium]|nr:hypothetical protein [Pseudomonadota bacterium]
MLIGSELLSYRTEVLFLFVYRFLIEANGCELSRVDGYSASIFTDPIKNVNLSALRCWQRQLQEPIITQFAPPN